jgi:hypothetical protein
MDRLTAHSEPESHARSYGFTWWMEAIYLLTAAVMLFAAFFLVVRIRDASFSAQIWHWIEAAALGLSGLYFAFSAFISCILIDDYSVNVRGLFFVSSLPRQSIQWYSTGRSQWIARTILYADAPEAKKLIIVHCYRFDREWDIWIDSLKRLPS